MHSTPSMQVSASASAAQREPWRSAACSATAAAAAPARRGGRGSGLGRCADLAPLARSAGHVQVERDRRAARAARHPAVLAVARRGRHVVEEHPHPARRERGVCGQYAAAITASTSGSNRAAHCSGWEGHPRVLGHAGGQHVERGGSWPASPTAQRRAAGGAPDSRSRRASAPVRSAATRFAAVPRMCCGGQWMRRLIGLSFGYRRVEVERAAEHLAEVLRCVRSGGRCRWRSPAVAGSRSRRLARPSCRSAASSVEAPASRARHPVVFQRGQRAVEQRRCIGQRRVALSERVARGCRPQHPVAVGVGADASDAAARRCARRIEHPGRRGDRVRIRIQREGGRIELQQMDERSRAR